jgi:hypothetical protein
LCFLTKPKLIATDDAIPVRIIKTVLYFLKFSIVLVYFGVNFSTINCISFSVFAEASRNFSVCLFSFNDGSLVLVVVVLTKAEIFHSLDRFMKLKEVAWLKFSLLLSRY